MTTGRINQVTTVAQRQHASSAASQRTQSARRPAAAGTAPSGRTVSARMCTRTAQHRSLQILAQKTIEQKTGQRLGSHAQPSNAVDGLAAGRQWASNFFYDSLPQAAESRCNLQKEERESRTSPSAQTTTNSADTRQESDSHWPGHAARSARTRGTPTKRQARHCLFEGWR